MACQNNFIRSVCIILLLQVTICIANAQQVPYDNTYVPNIIKSIDPTTAKIHSYNALPVSNYTGRPNISVPIFNIKLSDRFSMPVDLSYDVLSTKVDDIPSRNGFGWVMNVVGCVSRNVRDVNDFDTLGYSTGPLGDYDQGEYRISRLGWLRTTNQYLDYEDAMPDEYIVSAPGLSTRFVIRKDFTAMELTNQKNKIDLTIGTVPLGGFYINGEYYTRSARTAKVITITTPYGIKYTFDLYEVIWPASDSHFSCGSSITIGLDVGGNYLREIEDLSTKRKITFEYDEFKIGKYSQTTQEHFLGNATGTSWPSGAGNALIPCLENDKTTLYYEKNLRVTKIKFPSGECSFSYDQERQDVPGDFCLTGLVIKDLNGKVIRNNKFRYDYLNSFENCSEPECMRLKLTRMEECDEAGNCLPYKFYYNEQYQLPKRGSNLTDYLGYYNGPQEANVRRPKLYVYPNNYDETYIPFIRPSAPAGIVLPGRLMDVSETYLKTGVLEKIEYPTGGYISFEFESNDFKYKDDVIKGGGLRLKKQVMYFGYSQNAVDNKREISYRYTVDRNSTVSSGVLHSLPQFAIPIYDLATKDYTYYYNASLVTRTSQSSVDRIDGGYVGYKKVFVSENNNGYTEYTYREKDDYTPDADTRVMEGEGTDKNPSLISNSGWPFVKSNFNDQDRFGKPKEEKQVDASGNTIQLKEYSYKYEVSESLPVLYKGNYFTYTDPRAGGYYPLSINKPMEVRRTSCLPNGESTTYFSNNSPLKQTTEIKYRNGGFLPWQTITVGSDGRVSRTFITRVMDTVYQDAGKENCRLGLVAQNRVMEEVLNAQSKGDKSSCSVVDYQFFDGIVRFNKLKTITTDDVAFIDESRVDEYDGWGNPLKVWTRQNGVSRVLWDAPGLHLVANATGFKNVDGIFFSSFEDKTGWDNELTRYDITRPHSGRVAGKIEKLSAGEQVCMNTNTLYVSLPSATKFKFSGWVYSDGPSVEIFLFMKRAGETNYYTYIDAVATGVTGKWVYIEKETMVPADVTQLNIRLDNNGGGTVWFDDIRLHPSVAQMSTYTYDPLVGMTSKSDINNRVTHYDYDGLGRLMLVRDFDKNILKKVCYNYSGQPENCNNTNYHYSTDHSGTYYPQCTTGATPQPLYISVPAGKFKSLISPEDAENQAALYIQNYLNTNGKCITYVNVQYTNSSDGMPIFVRLQNISTNEEFHFMVENKGSGSLGVVPEGIYYVEITDNYYDDPYYSFNRYYQIGCGSPNSTTGTSARLWGITINNSCNKLIMY